MANYRIDERGYRLNPNVKPRDNVVIAAAEHRARKAKGSIKDQIENVLND